MVDEKAVKGSPSGYIDVGDGCWTLIVLVTVVFEM